MSVGDWVSEVWQKPPRSPTALISLQSLGPAGTSRALTEVSSMPLEALAEKSTVPPLPIAPML